MSPAATKRRKTANLVWAWDFGPALSGVDAARLLQLLAALQEVSSLGEAARAADMSYRAAWGLLRRCEAALAAPLVIMERGRGSRLATLGEQLVQLDSATRLALASAQEPWQQRMNRLLEPLSSPPPDRLRLIASHDLALAEAVELFFCRFNDAALVDVGEVDHAGHDQRVLVFLAEFFPIGDVRKDLLVRLEVLFGLGLGLGVRLGGR